jgi:hypothetical protein
LIFSQIVGLSRLPLVESSILRPKDVPSAESSRISSLIRGSPPESMTKGGGLNSDI